MCISPYCRSALEPPNFMKFIIRGHLTDVIKCVKFSVNRFRGYGVLTSPIDLLRRPYNSSQKSFTGIGTIGTNWESRMASSLRDHELSCHVPCAKIYLSSCTMLIRSGKNVVYGPSRLYSGMASIETLKDMLGHVLSVKRIIHLLVMNHSCRTM